MDSQLPDRLLEASKRSPDRVPNAMSNRPRRQPPPAATTLPHPGQRILPFREETWDVALCVYGTRVARNDDELVRCRVGDLVYDALKQGKPGARTAASAPCNALRLSTATTATRPILAASARADPVSAFEIRKVSPP